MLLHFDTSTLSGKQLNCLAPQFLESKRLEHTIKLNIISKKNRKQLDCEIFEIISKSRIYGPMSYEKGN